MEFLKLLQNHQRKNRLVNFNDEVETLEFESTEEEDQSLNIVEEFLRVPFKDPKAGYNLEIRSASHLGVYDEVERLILEDPNCVNLPNKHGWTPLMYAAQNGNVEVCQLLMRNGARVDAKNEEGQDAYELAKKWGHKRVMEAIKARTLLRQTNNVKK